jgi:ABC-type phosphate transport system substrate-binding protein
MRRRRNSLAVLAVTALTPLVLSACGRDQAEVALPACLDLAAVYALTGPEAIGEFSWSEAGDLAAEVGSAFADEFPDAPLTIYGPGEESGTFDSFNELAIVGIAEARGVPEDEALARPDYLASANDNVIIEGVAGTPGSFGWAGHAYAAHAEEAGEIRTFEVVGESGRCVAPSDDAIAEGAYPLSRDLYVYVNVESFEQDPAVAAFTDELIGDAGRAAVGDAGYVPLTDDAWADTVDAWAAAGGHPGEPAEDVAGEVVVSGSSTVQPITSLVAERFSGSNPRASVSIDGPGTGDGFQLFCDGETDLSDASRPIEAEEADACAASGVEYVELKIGIDGLSLVTRSDTHG